MSELNYRILYAGKRTCATCKHIRSGEFDEESVLYYVPYKGEKYGYCTNERVSTTSVVIRDNPDTDLPVVDCWEGE